MNSHFKPVVRSVFLTTLALIAFAANSVLCRLALGNGAIDAASFTVVRLISGAVVLFLIITLNRTPSTVTTKGSWFASAALFIYAIAFSYAYMTLDTATGALILFGTVQITMILLSVIAGNRLHLSEWLGVVLAFSGFVYLILPGVSTPSLLGFILMTLSGIAWGIYTLKGRSSQNPLMDTAYNFIRTVPVVIILGLLTLSSQQFNEAGIVYAILSGALASGIGYTIWYIALRDLSATQAAVVQLFVPVIAAAGGVLLVGEILSLRLVIAAIMILGGILLVILGRYYFVQLQLNKQV